MAAIVAQTIHSHYCFLLDDFCVLDTRIGFKALNILAGLLIQMFFSGIPQESYYSSAQQQETKHHRHHSVGLQGVAEDTGEVPV